MPEKNNSGGEVKTPFDSSSSVFLFLHYSESKVQIRIREMTAMVKTLLTSYRLIPAGTNSGALAESLDVLTIESTSLPLRGPGVPLPLAFCRGLLCFFESKRGRGHTLLVPHG